jgi:cytochrome P450
LSAYAEVFQNPDTFDIDRENAKAHLGFGHGTGYCLGSHLAQMEIQEMMTFLFTHFPKMQLMGNGIEMENLPLFRNKVKSMQLILQP